MVSKTEFKDTWTGLRMAESVALAGGMPPPPAGAGRWSVFDGSKLVEQTLQLSHA